MASMAFIWVLDGPASGKRAPRVSVYVWYRSSQYRGTSLTRNNAPLGPCSRTLHRALWWTWGKGLCLMGEVPR